MRRCRGLRPAERSVLLIALLVVAVVLRAAMIVAADVPEPLRVDAGQYARYAYNLVEHGVYSLSEDEPPLPDSLRPPGLPILLAICRVLAGEHGWYALCRWLQVLLSTATVLLSYRLARQFLAFAPSFVGAALVALSPHLVVAPMFLLTECLAGFLVTAGLWLLLGSASRGRTVLGALVLGCLPMCNEVMVYLPVVVAVVIWLRDRRRAVVVFLVAMLPLALWHVRNQSTELVRHGSERATASISHGSYPDMVFHDPRYRGFPYREDAEQPAFGKSWAGLWRVLLPRVRQEPLRYLQWYVLEKPQWLWRWPLVQGTDVYVYPVRNSPYDHHAMMAASYACMRWLHLPVMMLGLLVAGFGVLVGRRESSWALQALGCIAITGTLAYLPVIPDPRYLQPIRPLLFLLAAAALPLCLRWWRSREGRRGPKPASGI